MIVANNSLTVRGMVLTLCAVLAGCATNSGGQNAAGGAVIGAIAGCALAAAVDRDCGGGAALGALIGAAAGWSATSDKVASAASVNAEAERQGMRVPARDIVLKDYKLHVSQPVVEAGNGTVQVIGEIRLVGQSLHVPEVMQSMTLVGANGAPASETPQVARVERVDGAGLYRAIGTYRIPRGMAPGLYTVESALYIDGSREARRDVRFRVLVPSTNLKN